MSTSLSSASAAGGVRRLKASARREAIVLAAREVFCAGGLSGARMRAIAERAGVSEPLLYRHFSSREELFRVAVEDHLTTLLDRAIAEVNRVAGLVGGDRRALVTSLNRAYLEAMIEVAPLASAALYEDHARGKQLYGSVVRPRLREAAQVLYRANTGRDLPVGAENVVAVSLLGVHFGVALDGRLRGRPVDLDEMSERLGKLFRSRSATGWPA